MDRKIEKMEMCAKDVVQANIALLQRDFPSCVTECMGEDGQVQRKVDFEKLRLCLGDAVASVPERYDFTWAGKREAYMESTRRTTKTLRPDKEGSVNWDSTENLYIEGDNLDVLKILQESYLGAVKMIYIDPPYNTGSDFIYEDHFAQSSEEYGEKIGQFEIDGKKMFKNTETNGRFHSDWCSMIYARLLLARNLLSDEGIIFISIDDNEVENLKKICNEVFGEGNFIGQWNWFKSATPPNLSKKIKKNIEYILCYERRCNSVKYKGLKKNSPSSNGLLNRTNKTATLTFPADVVETGLADGEYAAGKYGTDHYEIYLLNDVRVSGGYFAEEFSLKAKFKWGQEKLLRELERGTKIAIRTLTFSPSYEKPEYDPEVPPNLIDKSVNVDTTEQAGKALADLFDGVKVFDYPKPVDLLMYLIDFVCGDEDIVMDFFSGSATTAHAVMRSNAVGAMRRKFILVQLPELTEEGSDAHKAGYGNICEIGKERIRRAGRRIKEEFPESSTDIGFRVFRVDASNMKDVYYAPEEYTQDLLERLESNVREDRCGEDLFFGCLLDWGLPLSMPYEVIRVDAYEIHIYNGGDLAACFQENLPEGVIRTIAKMKPLRAVFRDSAFDGSPSKINTLELFKMLAPDTRVKVI